MNMSMRPVVSSLHGRVTSAIALFLITVSITVLTGWAFDVAALKGLGGAITMKANAAVALFLAGIAFLALKSTRPWARTLGHIGARLIISRRQRRSYE